MTTVTPAGLEEKRRSRRSGARTDHKREREKPRLTRFHALIMDSARHKMGGGNLVRGLGVSGVDFSYCIERNSMAEKSGQDDICRQAEGMEASQTTHGFVCRRSISWSAGMTARLMTEQTLDIYAPALSYKLYKVHECQLLQDIRVVLLGRACSIL
jgi:hypothetical protein